MAQRGFRTLSRLLLFVTALAGFSVSAASVAMAAFSDLSIAFGANPNPVQPGGLIHYELAVTNSGPDTTSNVTVAISLPAGTTFESFDATRQCIAYTAGPVTCFVTTPIPPGTLRYIRYYVRVPDSAAEGSTLSATATLTSPDDVTPGDTQTITTTVSLADLRSTITDSPDPVAAGALITYTARLLNDGPGTATNARLDVTFPPGATFYNYAGSTFSSCTATLNGPAQCTANSLPSGESRQVGIVLRVPAGATDGSTLTASANAVGTTDNVNGNDGSSTTTTVFVPTSDLSVSISDAPDPVLAGATISYSISVANAGPDTATGAGFSLPLSGTTFVSASSPAGYTCTTPAVGSTGTVSCTGTIGPGGNPPFTVVAAVPVGTAGGTVIDATVEATGNQADFDTSNNTRTASTTVIGAAADLSAAVTDAPDPVLAGNDITYGITISNAGPSGATNAGFTQTLAGTTFVSLVSPGGYSCTTPAVGTTGTVSCAGGALASGASQTFTVVANVPAATPSGAITSPVTATNAGGVPDGNTSNDTATPSTTVTGLEADLSITMSDTPDPVAPGGEVTYSIALENAGPQDAANAGFSDPLPAGMTFVSLSSPAGWTCITPAAGSNGTVSCQRATFAVGGSASFTLVAAVPAATAGGTVFTNTATTVTQTADPNPANDAAVTTTTTPSSPTTTALTSSQNPSTQNLPVTFTATVTPVPPATGTPTGTVTFTSNGAAIGTAPLSGNTASLTTTALPPGANVIVAAYSGDQGFGSSASPPLTQQVSASGSLSLSISFGQQRYVAAGEAVQVAYLVTNTGSVQVDGISVSDPRVPAITCPATTLAPDAAMTCTGTLVITEADVAAGSVTLAATASGNGQPLATASATLQSGAAAVRAEAGQATAGFIETRNALISQGIAPPGVLGGSTPNTAGVSESNGLPVINYSASLLGAGADAASSLADGRSLTFNVWIDGSFVVHSRPAAGGTFSMTGLGADYLIEDTVLLGVAAYVDWMRDIGAVTTVEGYGGLVGPYLSVRLGEHAAFNASLFYGRSWNSVTTAMFGQTFTGRFETGRLVGTASLEGEWLIDQLTIRPDITLFLSHEGADAYAIRNGAGAAVTIPGAEVREFRLSTGLALEHRFVLDDSGLEVIPMIAVRGGIADPAAALSWADFFGSVSTGVTIANDNWSLKGTVEGTVESDGLRFGGVRGTFSGAF